VFTARYALSPYIKQIRFIFKGLKELWCFGAVTFFSPDSTAPSSCSIELAIFIIFVDVILWYVNSDKFWAVIILHSQHFSVVPVVYRWNYPADCAQRTRSKKFKGIL
jgi:hypothetical protein